nr:MAG TPA: hypothetical protein [Caudoviricetes sp.]
MNKGLFGFFRKMRFYLRFWGSYFMKLVPK